MADVKKLLQLVNGAPRTVDIANNNLVTDTLTVGGTGGTVLDQSSLDSLLSLANLETPGEIAFFAGQVAGMTTNITIAANNPGTDGNSISLSFDGSTAVNSAISAWNAANLSNQATLAAGDGSQIPDNGTSISLGGGTDASGASLIGVAGSPVNISPSAPTVQAYLEAIDAALVGGSSSQVVDIFTLNGTDESNKFVTLSSTPGTPADVILLVRDAPGMFFGVDFTVTGNQLSWSSLALDGILNSGDELTVTYSV